MPPRMRLRRRNRPDGVAFRWASAVFLLSVFALGFASGEVREEKSCTPQDRQEPEDGESNSSDVARRRDGVDPPDDGYVPPDYDAVRELSDFIVPPLRPGEFKLLRWKDGKELVQDYAARIGLPERTVPVLRKYARDLGMYDRIRRIHYEDPLEPESGRFFRTPAVYSGGRELEWYVQRPSAQYDSDLHWHGCADELSHESFLRALAEAGFDVVLDAIGEEYDLDGLAIQGVGFLATTHAEDGYIHSDWSDVEGKAFNVLIPLEQVPGSGPELYVSDEEANGEIKLHPSYCVFLGEDTFHGTHECDHRPTGKVRISVSIYLADLTEGNVERVAADDTAIFPLPGSARWLWAQRGRHWGGGRSMLDDLGRSEFRPEDKGAECAEMAKLGHCKDENAQRTRTDCPLSCGVYMTQEEYQPGVPRKELFY